jgi:glycosyltransferase involved in cell wall biosynthesis
MKVTLVNSFFPPWRGGAETYVYNLAKALTKRGHQITVSCANPPMRSGTTWQDGIEVKRHKLLTKIYGTPIMPSLFKDVLLTDTDIFHSNYPSPFTASIVACTSTIRRIPAVLTWHNDLPPVTAPARALVAIHDRLILPSYVGAYRRIISTSEVYRKSSRTLSKLGDLVAVVPNGVDCDRFRPDISSSKLTEKFGLEGRFVVLFVGALTKWHRYKGLDVLLNAMSMLLKTSKELTLLVVGDGELRGHYEAVSRQLGVSESTFFLGDIPDLQLPEYYSAADLLVLPSKDRSEGFGLTILEANATGKPVVASNIGGIPSVVKDNYNGVLVPPNDPAALSKALLRIFNNRSFAATMGRNGRKVAEKHDWSETAVLTERVYLEALAGKR